MKELDNRIRWLRQVARALHKQEWTDMVKMGRECGRKEKRPGKAVRHDIEWRPTLNAWGCKLCGRIARGGKRAAALRLSKRECGSHVMLNGIGAGHKIQMGWLDGAFSMAFCSTCGRWRSSKGKGLKGNCDPGAAQKTRLTRIREGKHPVNGRKFDYVRSIVNEKAQVAESRLDHDIPMDRVVRLLEDGHCQGHCGFDEEDWVQVDEDGHLEQAHGPFHHGPEDDQDSEPSW